MTPEEFNSLLVVVNGNPTTYGEIREHAKSTLAIFHTIGRDGLGEQIKQEPELTAGAVAGMSRVLLYLVDKIEEYTNDAERAEGGAAE